MSEETPADGLRERLEAAVGQLRETGAVYAIEDAEIRRIAAALLPVVEAHTAEETARLRDEADEAKQDADRGWKAADDEQQQNTEWAATCKQLMAHIEKLTAWMRPTRNACGAVATATAGLLGPCTIGGQHHPSFPHKDATGARWQVLTLPAGPETDDLTARLAAAYYERFTNDGHPEDSQVAAEVAMTILGPELDRLTKKLEATARIRDDAVQSLDTMQFDRDRLAAEVAELEKSLARSQQSRRNLRGLLEHHRDMGSLGMLRQHRNRLSRALRACARYRADRDRLRAAVSRALDLLEREHHAASSYTAQGIAVIRTAHDKAGEASC